MNNLEIDTAMFISEVQKRSLLWDPSNPDYGKPNCRQLCWEEITNLFFNDEEGGENERYTFGLMLQKRWKNLRGCFTRELLRQKAPCRDPRNPDRMKRKNHYMYYQNLLFLKGVVTNKSVDTYDDNSYSDEQDYYTDDTLSLVKIEYEPPPQSPKKKQKQDLEQDCYSVDTTSADCEVPQQLSKSKKQKTGAERDANATAIKIVSPEERDDADDSERLFLLSLVNPLKMVPQEERLAVQMEILNVINKAMHK